MDTVLDMVIKVRKGGYYEPVEKIKNMKTEQAISLLLDKYTPKKKSFLEEAGKDFDYVAGEIDKWLGKNKKTR